MTYILLKKRVYIIYIGRTYFFIELNIIIRHEHS